jgi:hypothetical protein
MIVIATDEAGYGPKLGPLVVAVSAWEVPDTPPVAAKIADAFTAIANPVLIDGQRIKVDDSKAVFQPKSKGKRGAVGYKKLERVTQAGCRWCGLASDRLAIVADLAGADGASIRAAPWLKAFDQEIIETDSGNPLVEHWRQGDAKLLWVRARVITAEAFNRSCSTGMNKSDLLSDTTLHLVRLALDQSTLPGDQTVAVFCDRHGGRRYYAGPLQSSFDGSLVQVIEEAKTESSYLVPYNDIRFTIRFTVKGDSFTPVAFSSILAKYLREKAMESFNRYFADRHTQAEPLCQTAGYPVDADRFLNDIAPIIRLEQIERDRLIRLR